MKHICYFEIDKQAKLAFNHEEGTYENVYSKIECKGNKDISDNDKEILINSLKNILSKKLNIDKSLITNITENEYKSYVEE